MRKGLKEAGSVSREGVLGAQTAGAKALGLVCARSHAGHLPSTVYFTSCNNSGKWVLSLELFHRLGRQSLGKLDHLVEASQVVGLGVAAAWSPTVQTLRPLPLTSIARLPPKHRCGKLFCVCVYLFLWLFYF